MEKHMIEESSVKDSVDRPTMERLEATYVICKIPEVCI